MDQADTACPEIDVHADAGTRLTDSPADRETFAPDLFRRLVELIDAVPYVWDIDSERYTYVAPQIERLLGFPPQDWLRKGFLVDHVAPEHRNTLLDTLNDFAANPGDDDADFCFVAADGRKVWLRDIGKLTYDSTGRNIYLGVLIDITDRRAAEQGVHDSKALLQSLIDAIPASIDVKDLEGRYVLVNQAFERRHNKDSIDLIGRAPQEVFDRSLAAQIAAMDQGDQDPCNPMGFREQVRHRADGTVETLLASAVPLLDARGNRSHVAGIALDISDRKNAEEALAKSEAKYRAIVESQTELVTRNAPDGTLTYVNKAYLDYFKVTAEQILGKSVLHHVPAEDRSLVRAHLSKLSPENATATGENRSILANGEVRWQFWTDRAFFDEAGGLVEVQSVGRDITDLKNAQRALQISEERHRRLVESANVIPFAINLNTMKFVYVGPQIARVLGYSMDRLIDAESWTANIHPDDRAGAIANSIIAKPDQPSHTLEYRMIAADGRIVWIREYSTNEKSADGTWLEYGLVFDITEQKRIEEALKDSEAQHRAIVEDQTEFVVRFKPGGIMTFVNGAFCRQLGLNSDQLLGRSWYVYLPEDDRRAAIRYLARITLDNPVVAFEHRTVRVDGEVRWESWINRGIFDQEGRIVAYQSVGRDITDKKLAEDRLKESESKYRAIVEDQTEFVVRYLPDGVMTFVNVAYCRYFGLSEDQLVGRSWYVDLPEDDRAKMEREHARISPSHPVISVEHRCILPSGEIRWESWTNRGIFDQDGRVLAYQSVGRDITDKKLAVDWLHESESRFRHLVESTDAVSYSLDLQAGCFTYVGPQAVRLLGYPVESWIGEEFWESAIHPDDRDRQIAHWYKSKTLKQDQIQEYRMVRADGATVWVRDILRLEADRNGRTVGYGLLIDITDAKQRDDQLRHAQKMDIVGQMTGGVAHDFNNLLTVIIGNLHLLEPIVVGNPTASRRLNLIKGAAQRGAELTKGLLAFARRQTLEAKLTDANSLVSGMCELLQRTLGGGIHIELALSEDLWPTVVDPAQFESVLVNLAVNARDAMGSGGRLLIGTTNEMVDVGSDVRRPFVMLSVADTGCGMPPDVLSKVFEPFFTTKPVGQGTGLGLSMVYGIVKQSGGRIEVDSEVGKGTTVRIYLPRAEAAADRSQASAGEASVKTECATILLVEPEAAARKTAVAFLAEMGLRVVEADGGPAALSILEANGSDFDLLVTNLTMPGNMSGAVLAHEATRRLPALKVLFSTTTSPGLQGQQWVSKPYVQQDFCTKVRAILSKAADS